MTSGPTLLPRWGIARSPHLTSIAWSAAAHPSPVRSLLTRNVLVELAMYYAVISHPDEQVGRILDALDRTGQADNTIIVYASDHGLAIGSHGLRGKQNMYEHTINVPLIFAGPGIPRGQRRSAQVYLRELYATLCELAGVAAPDTVEERGFGAVVRGEVPSIRDYAFAYFEDSQRMIRGDRWKLIHYPKIQRYQLFDLAQDPFELKDLSTVAAQRSRIASLREMLEAWQDRIGDPIRQDDRAQGHPAGARGADAVHDDGD
jgi:arylsulfatase A-like enzyme